MGRATDGFNYRILVVDDEQSIRETSSAILQTKGFEVRCADDGFSALAELRRSLPDVIISDLKMPNMSGFELLSIVRRRFPQIAVIAISGEFSTTAPVGMVADAFFGKAQYTHEELFLKISNLLSMSPLRPQSQKSDLAPVWVPRTDTGYFVLTCPDCLRAFSVPEEHSGPEVRTTKCLHCGGEVRYLADPKTIRINRGHVS